MKRPLLAIALSLVVMAWGTKQEKLMPRKTEIDRLQPVEMIGIDEPRDGTGGAAVALLLITLPMGMKGRQGRERAALPSKRGRGPRWPRP